MKRFLAKAVSSLIPNKVLRKRVRNALIGYEKPYCIRHKTYGKIYMPYYNKAALIGNEAPDIYNKFGQKMQTFFLRDLHSAHMPGHNFSKYFLFDRFDIGLDVHFYSHNAMLEQMGNPEKRYGVLIETPAMVPQDYKIFKKHKTLADDFDAIFTFDAEILESVKNAKFVPFCADLGVFYPQGFADENRFLRKTKNVSMISSHKRACAMHNLRYDLAWACKRLNEVDTFGTFDGGARVDSLADVYDAYRYSVIVENDIRPYQFSERIIAAFAAQTVPIYIGATKIDDFFNGKGIIKVSPENAEAEIAKIATMCGESDYAERLDAVKDNFLRAKKYANVFDTLYEDFLKKDIGIK